MKTTFSLFVLLCLMFTSCGCIQKTTTTMGGSSSLATITENKYYLYKNYDITITKPSYSGWVVVYSKTGVSEEEKTQILIEKGFLKVQRCYYDFAAGTKTCTDDVDQPIPDSTTPTRTSPPISTPTPTITTPSLTLSPTLRAIWDGYWCRSLPRYFYDSEGKAHTQIVKECFHIDRDGTYVYDTTTGTHLSGAWKYQNGYYVTNIAALMFDGYKVTDSGNEGPFTWSQDGV